MCYLGFQVDTIYYVIRSPTAPSGSTGCLVIPPTVQTQLLSVSLSLCAGWCLEDPNTTRHCNELTNCYELYEQHLTDRVAVKQLCLQCRDQNGRASKIGLEMKDSSSKYLKWSQDPLGIIMLCRILLYRIASCCVLSHCNISYCIVSYLIELYCITLICISSYRI